MSMRDMYYPLTHPQKGIWYTEKLHPHTSIGNIAGTAKIKGNIDYALLEKAINTAIQKNDSMRLRMVETEDEPKQYISEYNYIKLDFFDFSGKTIGELYKWDEYQTRKPFNLIESDLFYFALVKISHNEGGFYIKTHHLISDAWTISLIVNQIMEYYGCLVNGTAIPSEKMPSYTEFILREKSYKNSKKFIRDREFWNSRFTDVPEITSLKSKSAPFKSTRSKRKAFVIPVELASQIHRYCAESKTSIFTFFLAVLSIYISRVTQKKEIVLGTPVLNRCNAREKNIAGMFISTVPIRINIEEELDFSGFIQSIVKEWMLVLRHYEYPYDLLLKDIREKHRNSDHLYDIVLSYQNAKLNKSTYIGNYEGRWHFNGHQTDSLYIHIDERENDGNLILNYDYLPDVFSAKDMEYIHKHMLALLQDAIRNPHKKICRLEILEEEEKQRILLGFNRTETEYPKDKTIQQLFEEQVERTPHSLAAVFEDRQLSYRELNEKSNQLARVLRDRGVRPDSIVGIMIGRSLEMVIGIMAILKAGGAYLPIDPEYPDDRISYMLQDSGVELILTQAQLKDRIKPGPVIIEIDSPLVYTGNSSNLENINRSGDLAYVIYTSGSTGDPKAVMIEHKCVNNFTKGVCDLMDFSPGVTVLSISTISFDIFVFELLPSLMRGLKIVIANEDERKMPKLTSELILKHGVEKIHATPSRIQLLAEDKDCEACFKNIKEIIIGGEVFTKNLLERLKEITKARIFNGYGPTETTVGVTFKDLTEEKTINIGKPIANTRIYILDKYLNPVPIGVPGELYIAGEGLGRGYLNKPGLTEERFILNPFIPGEKMYKTGDLARWFPKGDIEFLGRIDHQVKIRGFRVELGEIENWILKYKGIKKAVVMDRENGQGKKYLCAYFESDTKLWLPDLRTFLSEKLPGYMIPSFFVQMDKIPLSPNGKVSRDELPEPETSTYITSEYIAPTDEVEKELAEIWCEVLKVTRVGIQDDFFELGGDSLSLISLVSKLNKHFNIQVPLEELYKVRTIKELGTYIKSAQKSLYIPIEPVEEQEYYPMSSAQKRLFVLMRLEEDSIAYNMPGIMVLEGKLDRTRFENAFAELIKRHEAFRTSFKMVDGKPVQKISDRVDFNIDFMESDETAVKEIIETFIRPFDLSKAPLLRVKLVKLAENRHILLLDLHHIICDGASMEILLHDLDKLYAGESLPALRIQYKDYCAWQNGLYHSDYIKKQEENWLNILSGEIPVLDLPTDYPRPSIQSYEGDILYFHAGKELSRSIKKLANQMGATLYMVLLAAYNVLLYKYSGQEDILVGAPIVGRRHADLEGIMGMFVNTLVMRNYPTASKKFSEFLEEVKAQALKAYENQDYPFEELVGKLKLRRDLSRNPLFDTMFVLQHVDTAEIKIGDLKLTPYKDIHRIAKFDLLLEAVERDEDIVFSLEYCTKLFKKATIERLIAHFTNILGIIASNPEKLLGEVDMLTGEERHRLFYHFNDTRRDSPVQGTIHQLFEKQAERTPDAAAVVFEGRKLTYRELNEKSNQLARALREIGVKPNSIVAISMYRSPEMVIGVLGILKAGGAFLPIDPDYPQGRIAYMLEDSNAPLLLTCGDLGEKIKYRGRMVNIDDSQLYKGACTNPETVNKPGDLLYVIYTSGSTGKPKGVMLEHKNMVNLMKYQFTKTNLEFRCKVLQFATISFDVCYQEIFSTLLSGGELHIAGDMLKRNAMELFRFIEENEIRTIFLPTSYLKLVINEEELLKRLPATVRHIIVAGEQLILTEQFKEYLKRNNICLHNHYGPSETHVVTAYTMMPDGDIPVLPPIGKPISNTRIYILGKDGMPLPVGIGGELYISGDSVGRGYLNRPDLSAEKFIPDPFFPGERMYKTGDIARWMPDGNIEFVGRIDHQVKIRGFRIELGEVESHLLNHPEIKEAVVAAQEGPLKNKYLCAYFVSDRELAVSDLRSFLSSKLPDYMIPSHFMRLEKMPLTPSGKIDRKALPMPDSNMDTAAGYEAPRNRIENELARIWSEVLHVDRIGINDNFFEMGGDSLAIIQVQIKAFSHDWGLTTQDFYQYQTIRELYSKISGELSSCENNTAVPEEYMDLFTGGVLEQAAGVETGFEQLKLDNVLLTGATGFLGIHILDEVLSSTEAHLYCLVRGRNHEHAQNRLMEMLEFYFGTKYSGEIGKRIHVVNGDITLPRLGMPEDLYSELGERTDMVIHTAALVKHYGDYHEYEKINVKGTKEVMEFCLSYGIPLGHISTVGISGNSPGKPEEKEKPVVLMTENDFYIGQNFKENVYVRSKFLAENLIYRATGSNLKAMVFRVGNLTGRHRDGHFQVNVDQNAFYNRIKSLIQMGAVSEDMLEQEVEFTPVDCCSKAIVKSIMGGVLPGKIFHMFNHHKIKLKDLFRLLESVGIHVEVLGKEQFKEYIEQISRDSSRQEILRGVIQDFNGEKELHYAPAVIVQSKDTVEYLKKLDFEWPDIDRAYILKLIEYMKKVGFLK
ncbi:MAG: amino acid adenylation domain-containing protein [Clostridiales bacterium]|nr:amino acid adenylation domain-containing protein [Eubacteriales bacterium]MDH7566648.1 amino acid adenylation domain-containing protein [Clostridiales bacterium]